MVLCSTFANKRSQNSITLSSTERWQEFSFSYCKVLSDWHRVFRQFLWWHSVCDGLDATWDWLLQQRKTMVSSSSLKISNCSHTEANICHTPIKQENLFDINIMISPTSQHHMEFSPGLTNLATNPPFFPGAIFPINVNDPQCAKVRKGSQLLSKKVCR